MVIPPPTHPCWQRLAGGALSRLKTQHLGTQFLIKNMERSKDSPHDKALAIRAYFTKWERLLAPEIQQLTTL